jgi:hypothetical protein
VASVTPEAALERLYADLATIDFSSQVVEGTPAPLHVVPVPACGWSDLGTPQRVAECLRRLGRSAGVPGTVRSLHLNLAAAYERLASSTPAMQTA